MTNNFYVERLNGKRYNMKKIGIHVSKLIIHAPIIRSEQDTMEGVDGFVENDVTYEGRIINAECTMVAKDVVDFPLKRNEVYKIFSSKEPFYLITEDEPGKRWLVRCSGNYDIRKMIISHWGKFEIEFASPSAFSHSKGTTLDPRTFDSGLWQVGQGLRAEDLKYTHDTNEFQIYNAGDETVDPRYMELVLKYHGSGDKLKISNHTTGDVWQYNESFTDSTIKLDGIHSYKNNTSIFSDTNKKLISIAPGFNDFSVEGTEGSFLISFDFRFYYL